MVIVDYVGGMGLGLSTENPVKENYELFNHATEEKSIINLSCKNPQFWINSNFHSDASRVNVKQRQFYNNPITVTNYHGWKNSIKQPYMEKTEANL